MEENLASTTLIDISRYCSSIADGDFWSSSQSSCSRSPVQRFFSPAPTRSSDSDSPILPSLPLPPATWSLTSSMAQMHLEPSFSSPWSTSPQQTCSCCRCANSSHPWSENLPDARPRPRSTKDKATLLIPTPIQRPPPPARRTSHPSSSLAIFDDDDEDEDDEETLRLHVSNIPFTWSKEKLAEVFGKYGTTFDVEVVYNERGSKGFGFVTFLAKKDALEAKRRMDREIVDGRRLVVNFAKPKQKSSSASKDSPHFSSANSKTNLSTWKTSSLSERPSRASVTPHPSLGFSTPPTARRQHLAGFSSLSSTPTRANNYQRYYL